MKHEITNKEAVVIYKGNRYGWGLVPEGKEGRKVFQGPMVPGPWGFLYGLCTVMDNHGGTGREMELLRERGLVIEVKDNDILVLNGTPHIVGPEGHYHPRLTVCEVEDEEEGENEWDYYDDGPDESMDGDHASALESCGMGDEDYGCYDDCDW